MPSSRDVVEQRRQVLRLVHDNFLRSLDDLPAERLWERPGHGFPIARLVGHVRDAIVFWLWREGEEPPPAIERGAPLETILESFEQVRGRLDEILASATDADLEAVWPSAAAVRIGGPAPSRGEPITLGFISKRLMQHGLYHGAQIDYIRTMGEEGWGRGRTYWEEAVDAVSACP
jgi:DinB superfamily